MKAAIVKDFDSPPTYGDIEPPPAPEGALELEVLAAALHPRVRSQADGSHYESDGELPLVPGVDGIGRTAAGELVYFVFPDTRFGSMAERAFVDRRRAAILPAAIDPVVTAAAMNPAMSSWIALRRRIELEPGASVLVLGATGSAGRLAVQIASHLGAARVIGAGRDAERLSQLNALGADATVRLGPEAGQSMAELAQAAAEANVDIVLDYLWGDVAAAAIPAILRRRPDRGRRLTWIEIGSMAGLEVPVASEWLRAARIELIGSGQGSVPTAEIAAELPGLAAEIASGDYAVDAEPTPLEDVERAWVSSLGSPRRTVFVP